MPLSVGRSTGPLGNSTDEAPCDLASTLTTLICRLELAKKADTEVIQWAGPIPAFGNLMSSAIATVGINPSNREFVDDRDMELAGRHRRFHTLGSLGLDSWLDADCRHLTFIMSACQQYFLRNPYDVWFKKLETIVSGTNATFYGTSANACHLDLIPYATVRKWAELTGSQRSTLLSIASDSLALLIRESPVRCLILNGASVVEHFGCLAGTQLQREPIPGGTLRRGTGSPVVGYGFRARVRVLCGVPLSHDVLVLGYNHNLQSSFGVTTGVIDAIRAWVKRAISEEHVCDPVTAS